MIVIFIYKNYKLYPGWLVTQQNWSISDHD